MLEFCVNQIIPIFRLSGFMTRQWRNRQPMMHRLGIFALMVLFVLQAIVVTSAPRVAPGADNETIVVCTGNGMKVMSLSDLGVDSVDDLDPNDPRHLASGDHCALCAFGHPALLSHSVAFVLPADSGLQGLQTLADLEPDSDGLYSPLQARAPPIFNG